MEFVFAIAGLFVQYIFLDKRELLYQRKSFLVIALISVVMFILSYVLLLNNIGNPKLVKLLMLPVFSVIVFAAVKYVFFKIYDRNPEDTFWSMDIKQMPDGIFNAVFWFSSIVFPLVFIYKVL